MLRRLLLLLMLASVSGAAAQTVTIGVFSLFHSRQLSITPAGSPILISAPGRFSVLLTGERGRRTATIYLAGSAMLLGPHRVTSITVSSRDGGETEFVLAIPGSITRRFRGVLTVSAKDERLVPIVRMDIETAVVSIVSAESVPGARLEALKAQAVAARSYLAAGSRHRDYDFCDTTHCQFLRSPPANGSAADLAAKETRGLVLTWHRQVFAAMYSSRCGGRTVSLRQFGVATDGYPYFSVECAWCRRHPLPNSAEGNLAHRGAHEINDGHGHGLGLCQYGAAGMAESGSKFDAILRHYYPETEIKTLSSLHASLP